jgi:hypothetical protein
MHAPRPQGAYNLAWLIRTGDAKLPDWRSSSQVRRANAVSFHNRCAVRGKSDGLQAEGRHRMDEADDRKRLRALWIAISNYEVHASTAFDVALIQCVNGMKIEPGFNVVSQALEATTISALRRIWDKTGDAARIAEIEKLLRRRPDLAGDSGPLRRWRGGVNMVEKSEELPSGLESDRSLGPIHPGQRRGQRLLQRHESGCWTSRRLHGAQADRRQADRGRRSPTLQ